MIDDLQVEMQTGGDSPHDLTTPGICEGYLLKGRKWPLKGWHKVRNLPNLFILHAEMLTSYKKKKSVLKKDDVSSRFQRYFVLEAGILRYSKNQQDVSEH